LEYIKINISDPQTKINSSVLIDELLGYGATYSSMTLLDQNGNSYYSRSSSDEWLKTYIESNLYVKCHLMQEAFNQAKNQKNGFIFQWDSYFPCNEESAYLNRMREEKNIAHGVAFCSPLDNGGKLILTVTGKYHDVNFSKNVLRNKNLVYKAVMSSLIPK
jgi:hypothetical protein